MRRVLIAGCGYVGSHLALELVQGGDEVIALARRRVELPGVEWLRADLTDEAMLSVPDVDIAVFTAAPDTSDEDAYRAVYVDGLRNLARGLSPDCRLIFTSSTAVYGQDDGSVVDESSPTVPLGFRGRVLLEAEQLAHVALRLGGIYGPSRVRALERVRRGEGRYVEGRFLNFIHRDDASGALAHLMALDDPDSVYIGVDDEPVESERYQRWLAEVTRGEAPSVDDTPRGKNKRCSNARLKASGYTFRYPTFREGNVELID